MADNKPIKVVIAADIENSITRLERDIHKLELEMRKKAPLNVIASVNEIRIDRTAVNYVTKEIKKMFNTVTVDIDGNILGVGKGAATAVKKQTDAIQKAVLTAQKKLSNIKTDYGGNMSSAQTAELEAYQKRLDALKSSVDTTAPEIAELSNNMDVFAHTLAKQKKDLAANAAEMKKVAAAYREADKAVDDIAANHLGNLNDAQTSQYDSLVKQLYAAKNSNIPDLKTAESIRNQLKDLQLAAKTTAKVQKQADQDAAKARTARQKATNELVAAEKKLLSLSQQVQNTIGDIKGLDARSDPGASSAMLGLTKYIDTSKHASEKTKQLNRDLMDTYHEFHKIDSVRLDSLLDSFNEDIKGLGTNELNQVTASLKEITSVFEKAKLAASGYQHELGDNTADQRFRNSVQQNIRKLEEFYSKHSKLRMNKSFSSEYKDIIDELNNSLEVGDETGAKKAADHLSDYIHRAKEAGLTTDTLGEKIQKAFQKFGGWAIITGSMMRVIQTIKDMVSNVVRLDACLTELRKVTDETSDSYDRFMQRTKNTAKEIGSTVTDLVAATADWGRLGYSLSDAEKLAKISTIYANVGDDIESIDDATANLISTIQGFQELDASDALSVVDILNRVSNEFPASAGGLGESLRRSSAALSAAGNTLQESVALITAADAVLQDPSSTGTMMKTISMYLRAAKTDLEAAGESTDGMASSVSELRSEIMALTGNRVDIMLNED